MKKAIFIEATRDGYGPEQCTTMTLNDLICALEELANDYGEDCEVYLRHDRGYTYGGIGWHDMAAGCYDSHGTYDEDSEEFAEAMGWQDFEG